MKPTVALSSLLLGSFILAASPQLHADARYWDGADTGANAQGGNGAWDISTANWDSAAMAGTNVTFASGPHQAVFGGTAGTVNVSGTVSVSGASTSAGTGGIVFTTSGYSIGGSGTIQLGGNAFIHTLGTTTFGSSLIIDNNGNTLTLSNGGTFNGEIKGSGGLAKGGGGTATFAYANTYTGTTTITQGTLIVGTDSLSNTNGAFGKATSDINFGGPGLNNNQNASILIGGAFNVGRIIRAATSDGTDVGTRVLTLGGNTADNSTFSGDIFLGTTNRTSHGITVTAVSGGQVTFSGNIQNPTGQDASEAAGAAALTAVTKTGAGTVVLSGNNTYTGATMVSAGVLAVNGTLANTTTTVTGGTLRGTGSIGGSVTIQNGGTLAAGNSIESLATGALSLEALSTFAYEMNNNVAAGVAGDLTAVTGTLDIASTANLTLTELGAGSWTVGEKLTLISYSGAWNNGLFTYLGNTLADDSTFSFSGMSWFFNYNDIDAGDNYSDDLTGSKFVTMTAVPEPGIATLACGLGMLMFLRRRRTEGARNFR